MLVPKEASSYIGIHLLYKMGAEPGSDFDIESALPGYNNQELLDLVLESCNELPTYKDRGETHEQYRRCVEASEVGHLHYRILKLISEAVLMYQNPGIQCSVKRRRRRTEEE